MIVKIKLPILQYPFLAVLDTVVKAVAAEFGDIESEDVTDSDDETVSGSDEEEDMSDYGEDGNGADDRYVFLLLILTEPPHVARSGTLLFSHPSEKRIHLILRYSAKWLDV